MTPDMLQMLTMLGVAASVGGLVYWVLQPYVDGDKARSKRVQEIVNQNATRRKLAQQSQKERKRKQLQEAIREIEEANTGSGQRLTLKARLRHAGLNIPVWQFYVLALVSGLVLGLVFLILSGTPIVALGGVVIGGLGVPLWLLSFLRNRRQEMFLRYLPDAVDTLVRNLKAGLPINEALKTIADEMPEPLGPEFREIVEGQKIGIPLDQGFQRMYERMPLPEVNFLSIIISIQQKTGGNLSEALSNLSGVLRDRKRMKLKIKALSQEAKVGAIIIGSLPVIIFMAIYVFNPDYFDNLTKTSIGITLIVGSLMWMSIGIFSMYKMINFKF